MPKFVSIPTNAFGRTPKDDPRDRLEIEIGDAKQTAFFPQTKIIRWDGEVNLSFRLIHNELNPVVTNTPDRVSWDGSKIKAEFYELPASDEHPEGASEFDITLKEKPATNKIEFTLNTKGVDFLYQPPLTQAEIDEGVVRPDHVIGSYAVFASEEKVNYVGGKLYKSGKVGHIYRPKIIDANGVETWGDLNIIGGLLTVTIPQNFLDNAVYPVRHAAGLTVGYTGAGASVASNFSAGDTWLSKGTPTGAATISSISLYAGDRNDPTAVNVKTAIWKVSDKTLVGNSSGFGFVGAGDSSGNPAWGTDTWSLGITAVAHYIGYINQNGFEVNPKYDTGSAGDGGDITASYTTPTTLGTINNTSRKYSVYATYSLSIAITEIGTLDDYGSIQVGVSAPNQTFTVSAVGLTADLVVTAPNTDFQVSLSSGSGFGSSVSITPTSGTVATTTIYCRFTPQSTGAKSGNVACTSIGATTQNVAVAGTGIAFAYYNPSWGFRHLISVDPKKVDADLTDFTVLVDPSTLPAGFHTNVNQTDARDVRITKADGTTELARESVYYVSASDTGELHFKADTLSDTIRTNFYIYFGNASATEPAANSTYGSDNAWNSNYKAVYHLGTPSALAVLDATGNSFDATNTGTSAGTGKIGGAGSFNGTTNTITLPSTGDYNVRGNSGFLAAEAFTLQCWYKGTDTAQNTDFGKGLIAWNNGNFYGGLILRSGYVEYLHYVSGWVHTIKSTTLVADGAWHCITLVNFTNSTATLYIDGVAEVSASGSTLSDPTNRYFQPYNIGSGYNNAFTSGLIDEARIAAASLTAAWVTTEYHNQNSPSTFYSVGVQETAPLTALFFPQRRTNQAIFRASNY